MRADFTAARSVTTHPTARGDSGEQAWRQTLEDFLPRRFAVSRAFVVDSLGNSSEQIDLVIHDRHFSPTFWTIEGTRFIPAECVLAVLEVKPKLSKANVAAAAKKAASVRRLHRTSAPIRQLAQPAGPAAPQRVLSGLVAVQSAWTPPLGQPLVDALAILDDEHRLDLGCGLEAGMFELPEGAADDQLLTSPADVGLAMFAMRLVARLNAVGTVPALDYDAYTAALTSPVATEGAQP